MMISHSAPGWCPLFAFQRAQIWNMLKNPSVMSFCSFHKSERLACSSSVLANHTSFSLQTLGMIPPVRSNTCKIDPPGTSVSPGRSWSRPYRIIAETAATPEIMSLQTNLDRQDNIITETPIFFRCPGTSPGLTELL